LDTRIHEQLQAALHSSSPADGLVEVVQQMKQAGKSQQEIYRVFEALLQTVMDAGTEHEDEAIREVMDRSVGWCSPDQKLFESYLKI
jgi:hypothetical protein